MVKLHFTRRFFGTGQQATHHHGACASGNGFRQVAREAYAAIGNQRNVELFQRFGYVGNGGDLRYANACHNTRGADRAGADAYFHGVCACFGQRFGSGGGGDVAADHLNLGEVLFDPANAVNHALGVAVGGIDDDHVNAGFGQCGYAVRGFRAGADRCAY